MSTSQNSPVLPLSASAVDVSVIVPVYGGAQTIGPLCAGIRDEMDRLGWTWEVIFVCDRPRDDSWAVARQLAAADARVSAYLLMRNFGQHPATLHGLRVARGRLLVTMDEDLQHSPRDIEALATAAREIDGIAFGTFEEPQHGWWRNLTSRLAKAFLARYVGTQIASHATAFRAFPAHLRAAFADYRGERVAIDVLLSWSGAPFRSVRAAHAPRASGASGYTLRKLVAYLGDLVVGYSVAPLRLASFFGLAAFGFAMLVAGYVLFNWLRYGSAVPGFAFIALSVALFSGAQLLTLGIIGEYLGRLYFSQLGKPQVVVAARAPGPDAAAVGSSATSAQGSPAS